MCTGAGDDGAAQGSPSAVLVLRQQVSGRHLGLPRPNSDSLVLSCAEQSEEEESELVSVGSRCEGASSADVSPGQLPFIVDACLVSSN